MRTSPILTRSICAAVLALLLSIRLLTPAGFMPAFDRTGITIVACPGADGGIGSMPMHKHRGKAMHEPCPYASASTLGALGPDWTPLLPTILFAIVLILGRGLLFVARHNDRERPPAIGPPIPA